MSKILLDGERYLITTNAWFYGPDGEQYRAAYGPAELVKASDELGFVPTRSANWYVRVGHENNHVVLAGCQVSYLLRTDRRPDKRPGHHPQKEGERSTPVNSILFLDSDEHESIETHGVIRMTTEARP